MSDEQGGNMRVWDALIGTDPQHTSTFKRAGGFQGTAMRPMWAIKHMTEQFGPIGIGWGFEETDQKIIEAGEEMLVYSKASVWYADGAQIAHTPSQWGGDKIMVKRRDGSVQSDDEAPKKALTDAVLKCLSYIGLGADIHLGQFEDSKYVEEINQKYREQEAISQEQAADIRKRIADTGTDEAKFLRWLKVDSVESIPETMYQRAVDALDKKAAKESGND